MGHPTDEADITGGNQPDHGPDKQGTHHDRGRETVGGDVQVGGMSGQVGPGRQRGDKRARHGRQGGRQGGRPEQHLDGEKGSPERHVVNGAQAGAGAARHQQPALCIREAEPAGHDAARRRPHQFGGVLPADRSPHPDDELGDEPGAQAPSERKAPVTAPDGVVDL